MDIPPNVPEWDDHFTPSGIRTRILPELYQQLGQEAFVDIAKNGKSTGIIRFLPRDTSK